MDLNSIIEIGSKADVILRFKADKTLNGKTYLAGEPYLYLKDVSIVINYSNQDKTGDTDRTVVAFSDIKPRAVQIGNIVFSRKLISLIATFESENQDYDFSKFDSITAAGTSLFLTNPIDDASDYFVYDENFDIVEGITYDNTNNSLESANIVSGQEYIVYYSSVGTGTKFILNKPFLPYMSLEVQGKGNIDKVTKNVLLYFDKVSLNAIMQFTFIQDEIINIPLNFHIIDDANNYVVFED